MNLNVAYLLHHLFDALVGSSLVAEKNVAVGVRNLVALIDQLLELANVLVFAPDAPHLNHRQRDTGCRARPDNDPHLQDGLNDEKPTYGEMKRDRDAQRPAAD
ncbi:hypothetical protein [Pseudomonas helleri]|uniref:hypothetical protein n=1 Tax=Pseudomonas helleri TaxID=1608996 RepID=UPI0021C82565|nr:hypothetical protein [Pseudomonas helleri]MCU1754144.1 hypothetical protein [Pseudomonas helleri]